MLWVLVIGLLSPLWQAHAATIDDQFVHDMIKAEEWLDTTCRASNELEHHGKIACKARQSIYEIIDENNWCFGKIGQIGADMRWHKCTKNSERPTEEDFHRYD